MTWTSCTTFGVTYFSTDFGPGNYWTLKQPRITLGVVFGGVDADNPKIASSLWNFPRASPPRVSRGDHFLFSPHLSTALFQHIGGTDDGTMTAALNEPLNSDPMDLLQWDEWYTISAGSFLTSMICFGGNLAFRILTLFSKAMVNATIAALSIHKDSWHNIYY